MYIIAGSTGTLGSAIVNELSKDNEVKKEYRDYFFKKEIVKVIYLLDELDEDKYAKFMLRHLALDNICLLYTSPSPRDRG